MQVRKISELIAELQKLRQTHGDVEVVNTSDDYLTLEFNEDEGSNPAVVIE